MRRSNPSGVANAWRFEVHAVAAGAAPDEQYLGLATSCDVYVLIVADQQSEATEQEYAKAYEDNPEKVLCFFVGEGSPEVASFRATIENRHTRVMRKTAGDLAEPIGAAVIEAVETELLRPLLRADLESRIERARTLIADVPYVALPEVVEAEGAVSAIELIVAGSHVALSGIGGSGKSVSAAIVALSLGRDDRTLTIFAQAIGPARTVLELIAQRLDAFRFQANAEILHRWASEGRICLVVDGIESARSGARHELMESISAWSERYPRCTTIVCARRFSHSSCQHSDMSHLHRSTTHSCPILQGFWESQSPILL